MNLLHVTQVLQPWSDFSGVSPRILYTAAIRGMTVHKACAGLATGLFICGEDVEYAGYIKSFRSWFDLYVDKVLFVEKTFINQSLGIVGTPDLFCLLKTGERALIDLKTPATEYKSWRVQLAAYQMLVSQEYEIDVYGTLRLLADGGLAVFKRYERQAEDYAIFLSALNCYRYFNPQGKGDGNGF